MEINRNDMLELANLVATAVINALEKKNIINNATTINAATTITTPTSTTTLGKHKSSDKSAYSKTEALLYNYRGFKRIVEERMKEIDDLYKYGVPQRCGVMGERVQNGNLPQGIVLPEETVENAVHTVEKSVEGTIRAIELIDKCMAALKSDPYYKILEMRYFEGRTQEDIALEFGCSQVTISNNKSRLVRELSMRLFPNQVIDEMLH